MNLKGKIVWIVLTLVVTGAATIVTAQVTSEKRVSPAQPAPASERFQIVFSPHARADTFLVDTQTGRIWSRNHFSDLKGDPDAWLYEARLDSDAEYYKWLAGQALKDKGSAK